MSLPTFSDVLQRSRIVSCSGTKKDREKIIELYDYCKKIKTGKIVNDTIIYKTKYNKHPREGITNIRLRCVETSCKLSIEGKIYPFELDKPLYW